MRPRARGGAGAGKHRDKLHTFMVGVQNLVRGGEEEGPVDPRPRRGPVVQRKSRKELRREKRKLKKKNKKKKNNIKVQPQTSPSNQDLDEKQQGKHQSAGAGPKKVPALRPTPPSKPDRPAPTQVKKVRFEKVPTGPVEKPRVDIVRNKALLEANEAEDREIKRLEKRLGLHKRKNKRKLPQSFVDDGLGYILGILEPGGCGPLHSDDDGDDDEGAARAKAKLEKLEEDSEDDGDRDGSDPDDAEGEECEDDDVEDEDMEEEDDDEGEEEMDEGEGAGDEGGEDQGLEDKEVHEVEENQDQESQDEPSSAAAACRYLPPQLREEAQSKRRAELERLKRHLKGLINRLSEVNMASISKQVEEMYMSCSRKDMNEALTELLMAACVTPALMPDRLLMEHMLLVSVLHHTVGLEVGAHFLEAVVRRFDGIQRGPAQDEGGQAANLASMLAHLYNFQVVHALLPLDVLRRLLEAFSARDVELLLLLLRAAGFTLRRDEPLGLKELITHAQHRASEAGARFSDQTRVRFMLETMLALKNNDMRKIPGYDPEPVERLRKLQRSLIQNRAGGTDVKLRVSLENLLEAERVGRWWIVGSSWSGAPMIAAEKPAAAPTGEQFSSRVLEMARAQRMNTDVRRNVFCVIMTSEDYLDAFEKLLRLGLKGLQERDIVHVLLDCCLQEKTFNGFYAVLAEKFCAHDRRFQMTFQFSLWDKFKDLATLSSSSFNNLVQMVAQLLHKNALSLSILKAIEFGELDKPRVKFLRQVLSKLLQETQPEDLVQIFGRISGIPKLGMLCEGLKLFIRHFLLRNAQSDETLSERAEISIRAMEARDAKLKL